MKYLNAAVQFKLKNYANICTTAAANKKLTRQKTVARKKAGSEVRAGESKERKQERAAKREEK